MQDFLKYNSTCLQKLPCQISDPIPLGSEDAEAIAKGGLMALPEGATLFDLINSGVNYRQASVGVVVRLREELSLVKDIPVLFAVDQVPIFIHFRNVRIMFLIFLHYLQIILMITYLMLYTFSTTAGSHLANTRSKSLFIPVNKFMQNT